MRTSASAYLLCGLLFLGILGSSGSARAQLRPLDYSVTTSVQGAIHGTTPFWHYANTRGRYRAGSRANWVSGASLRLPFRGDAGLDASLGAEAVSRISEADNTLHLLHLYGKLQYRGFRLSVGRFPETIGLNGKKLSMGSLMVSRNAPPVPKIKLFTPEFLDVPFTDGHVQFRARWSDGRLGADRTIKSPLLHQKSFYLKFRINDFAVTGGAVQNTMWGGAGQSQELRDYTKVLLGSQAGVGADSNRVGNSIGAYDFALQYGLENWTLRAYRLFYLEDTVSLRFRSPWDGMWGLGIRRTKGNGWINGVLYEHMNTIQQDAIPGAPSGRASYYNHFIYESGWTYEDTVLGNPLFVFDPDRGLVVNNMVIAHHVGVTGAPMPRLEYTAGFTYSRNYGICEDQILSGTCEVLSYRPAPPNQDVRPRGELREDQYSLLAEVRYLLSEGYGLQFIGSTAFDFGSFYDERWGLKVGLQWDGSIQLK